MYYFFDIKNYTISVSFTQKPSDLHKICMIKFWTRTQLRGQVFFIFPLGLVSHPLGNTASATGIRQMVIS